MPTTRRDFLTGLALGAVTLHPGPFPQCSEGEPSSLLDDPAEWTIYVANDTCPDYTWGNDETQIRHNFTELVRARLDLMSRTDGDAPRDRDRYIMAVTME